MAASFSDKKVALEDDAEIETCPMGNLGSLRWGRQATNTRI
jgi:hypothetical protein